MSGDFDEAIARIPRWILLLASAGTVLAGSVYGLSAAGGYLVGALGAWVNYRVIEKAATRITRVGERAGGGSGVWIFIRFAALLLAALAILTFSGFSRSAAFLGLLITPAAVILEIIYELVTLRH